MQDSAAAFVSHATVASAAQSYLSLAAYAAASVSPEQPFNSPVSSNSKCIALWLTVVACFHGYWLCAAVLHKVAIFKAALPGANVTACLRFFDTAIVNFVLYYDCLRNCQCNRICDAELHNFRKYNAFFALFAMKSFLHCGACFVWLFKCTRYASTASIVTWVWVQCTLRIA